MRVRKYISNTARSPKILSFIIGTTFKGKNLLPLEAFFFPLRVSYFFSRFFLGMRKNNSVLATPLRTINKIEEIKTL